MRCLGFLVASAPTSTSSVLSPSVTACSLVIDSTEENFCSLMEGNYDLELNIVFVDVLFIILSYVLY